MLGEHVVALLLQVAGTGAQPAPRDSMDHIRYAQELVADHYRSPMPWTDACTGVSLEDCRQGDWSCRTGGDCKHRFPGVLERLAERLEDLAPRAGASDWLFRQRVGFAVKAGELDRARRIAESCNATAWECKALRGFVAHQLRSGRALAHFDSALAVAPLSVRCEWTDLTPLLGPEEAPVGALSWCDPQARSVVERFWWLADPLWSQDGNERYAEHLSRHVMTRINEDMLMLMDSIQKDGYTSIPYIRANLYDRYQLNIAQGFWNSWRMIPWECGLIPEVVGVAFRGPAACMGERRPGVRGRAPGRGGYAVSRFFVNGGYGFAPDGRKLAEPAATVAEEWEVHWDRGGPNDERWIPREKWTNLDHQTAVFRRGLDIMVIAAASLPWEPDSPEVQAFLALGRVADLTVRTAAARIDGAGVLRAAMRVDSGAHVASIEARIPGQVARARHGVQLPVLVGDFGVSDMAFVAADSGDSPEVQETLLPSLVFEASGRVGIAFEVYGVSEGETLQVTLSGQRFRRSFLGRIAGLFGLGSPDSSVIEWQEPARDVENGRTLRFLTLDLSGMDRGQHQLVLTVRRSDGTVASATREVRIR
jgi:hypothetical protein